MSFFRVPNRTALSVYVLPLAALALAGCMSSGRQLQPLTPVPTTAVSATALPQPITLAEETPVETQALDDVAISGLEGLGQDGSLESDPFGETGALDQAGGDAGAGIDENDMIGVWSAVTPAANCSVNLSLTSWQGGFRASTRNCGDVQLATLSAWSVEGQQVLLLGTEGTPLGRLFRTGPTRYAGQLETGEALTFFR